VIIKLSLARVLSAVTGALAVLAFVQ